MTNNEKIGKEQFFRDRHGRVVTWQIPNTPIIGWLLFKILSSLVSDLQFKTGFASISSAFLFTWAFLEITQGVNYFRRVVGLIVMIILVISFFRL